MARRALSSSRNVLELARFGRLGAPYRAPFEVVDEGPHHRLRRYATCKDASAPIALLVPPLMVTSEVYDVEENNSAVNTLGEHGVQPCVVDFGAPERAEGGMRRTLDDHVVAVVRSIAYLEQRYGKDIHLLGYSQGGMFAYQAAAFVRSVGIRSIVTFGAPIDIHKSLPNVHKDATALFLRFIDPIFSKAVESIEGLPGALTSTGFKVLSTRKEIGQRLDFLRKLHDRGALVRREARRRFLGGEGFVAWPGPAFREFVDQFIVHNRMLSGGFVLSGKTVTLADIRCPILAFIGSHDDMARPAAVRAIVGAAPNANVTFATVDAGHFGIVVGSGATRETWPTVAGWVRHVEGLGPLPAKLATPSEPARRSATEDEPEGAGFDVDVDLSFLFDAVGGTIRSAWSRMGDAASSASDALDAIRYQEPRLRRLANLLPDSRVSAGLALAERARKHPDATFFLWRSRAFTYRDADTRVSNVVRGLYACGVRPGDRVGVLMGSRPSFLSMVTALSRLGAVAVLAPPTASVDALTKALAEASVRFVATDPENAPASRRAFDGEVLLLGGGPKHTVPVANVIDMEAIDPHRVDLPETLVLDRGRARDLSMILLRPSERGGLRQAPVTNHRWALSAIGAAAACTIKPDDTVYCAIPLHHPAGVLVSVGSALAGGARLALAEGFDPQRFVPEVRRYGATVAFYAGEMLRPLVHRRPDATDTSTPLRLFAGSGMRVDLGRKLKERFGVGVMEFYASTTQKVILANASGEKVGAIGRPLPGSAPVEVARMDPRTLALVRNDEGRLVRASEREPGVLVARLDASDELSSADLVAADAFEPGDRWYVSNDVVEVDDEGDLWFVDAKSGFVDTPGGAVSTRTIEGALFSLPEVEMAAAWADKEGIRAAIVAHEAPVEERLREALATLPPHARPYRISVVDELTLTEGFRPNKRLAAVSTSYADLSRGQSSSQTSEPSRE